MAAICSSSGPIRCPSDQRAYQRTLKQIDGLIRKAKRSRAEDDLLELLATFVEQYELRQGYMVPKRSPRDRLAGLIEAKQLMWYSASWRIRSF